MERQVDLSSDLIRGVLVLALIFVRDLNAIYAIFFAMSTVSSFFVPAQSVAVRALAPATGIMSVNAMISPVQAPKLSVRPLPACFSSGSAQTHSCIMTASVSFSSAVMVMTLSIHRQPSPSTAASTMLESMAQGFRFILTHGAISP